MSSLTNLAKLQAHAQWRYAPSEMANSLSEGINAILQDWGEIDARKQQLMVNNLCKALTIAEQLYEIFLNDHGLKVVQTYLQPTSNTDFNVFVIIDPVDYLSQKMAPAYSIAHRAEDENEDEVFSIFPSFHPYALNTVDDVLGEGGYFEYLPEVRG